MNIVSVKLFQGNVHGNSCSRVLVSHCSLLFLVYFIFVKCFVSLFSLKTISSVQFSHSVMSNSVTPWTAARQASLEACIQTKASFSPWTLWCAPCDQIGQFSVIGVSVCLRSDALSQHLLSYQGFSYVGCGVPLHGYHSKTQLLLLALDIGYLLTAATTDLKHGVSPFTCSTLPRSHWRHSRQ